MTTQEAAILDAVNIASTLYRRAGHDFEATAAQITEVLNTDERLRAEYAPALLDLNSRQVGRYMSGLLGHHKYPRPEPLVTRLPGARYRLTRAALKAMIA